MEVEEKKDAKEKEKKALSQKEGQRITGFRKHGNNRAVKTLPETQDNAGK